LILDLVCEDRHSKTEYISHLSSKFVRSSSQLVVEIETRRRRGESCISGRGEEAKRQGVGESWVASASLRDGDCVT